MKEFEIVSVRTENRVEIKDYEAVKQILDALLQNYKDIQVTEENKVDAKKDLAAIRKIRKALEDKRIALKKEYDEPFNFFAEQIKELVAMIDNPIKQIDEQIKTIEAQQDIEKQEAEKKKLEMLQTHFKGLNIDWLTFEDVYKPVMDSVGLEDAIEFMNMQIEAFKTLINSMDYEMKIAYFATGLDSNRAIQYLNERKKAEQRIALFQSANLPF